MKKSDVIAHFGGVIKTAEALGIKKSSVSQWGEEIPEGRAYQIQVMTGGKLKVRKTLQPERQPA